MPPASRPLIPGPAAIVYPVSAAECATDRAANRFAIGNLSIAAIIFPPVPHSRTDSAYSPPPVRPRWTLVSDDPVRTCRKSTRPG
jgi:hypothetical protein